MTLEMMISMPVPVESIFVELNVDGKSSKVKLNGSKIKTTQISIFNGVGVTVVVNKCLG